MSEVNPKSKGIKKSRGGAGKKKKDPNAPKRPRTAYILFCAYYHWFFYGLVLALTFRL